MAKKKTTKRRVDYGLKVGQTLQRTYKGKEITAKILKEGVQVGKKTFSSLTAAAKGIIGSDQPISGPSFFGLYAKHQEAMAAMVSTSQHTKKATKKAASK